MVDDVGHHSTGLNQENASYTKEPRKEHNLGEKSYSDKRRRPLAFEEGDHVYLRVSPMKGVHRFGVKGKLAPRYVGPFKITREMWIGSLPNYYHTLLRFMMCFTSRNSRSAYECQRKAPHKDPRPKAKCCGIITPKNRQLGSKKNSCEQDILIFFHPLQIEYVTAVSKFQIHTRIFPLFSSH
ncbi:LOW QUALITY PROTEIN: hypothetical protein U9M48_034495 [Paspalum notatum var. saurae]|uniref:Tf2-1-like SH3-like domain-containing protein n=1 Tax=Paspalum notatum var. saurae TaxID=547442 RepID=A0AAQ3UD11_PASNO